MTEREGEPVQIPIRGPRGRIPRLLTADLPGTGGRIRERLEDFVVDEVPAYLPCGEGEHLMVLVEKRELTTDEAARILADRVGTRPGAVGFAGRKDRRAVATQWMTVQGGGDGGRLDGLETDGLRVLRVDRHRNKLKAGHLHGNRFRVVVRGVSEDAEARARAVLARIEAEGLPNAFGPQRFGRDGDNPERALAWILGRGRPPRDKRRRRLLVSSLQAALFNDVLDRRLETGHLSTPLDGDLLKVRATGGMFLAPDDGEVAARVRSGEVSPTGPIFGARMWWPEGAALALEESVLAAEGLGRADLDRFRADGRGSRRPLRVFPEGLEVSGQGDALELRFTLEPGAFATTLLAEVTKAEDLGATDAPEVG